MKAEGVKIEQRCSRECLR